MKAMTKKIKIRQLRKEDIIKVDKMFLKQNWSSRVDTLNIYFKEQ